MTAPAKAGLFPRWALPLAAAAIILASAAAYWGSLGSPFVFDDTDSIVDNPSLRHLWPPLAPLSPPHSEGQTVGGRPVLNLSLALNYAAGGLDVRGYRAANVAIHALAGLLLLGIARRTFARIGAERADLLGFAVALLWTVHPLQTESVTYVVQRAESLMGLFYLGSLYAFIRGAESGDGTRRLWHGLAVASCLLGMATKEVMASAPVIIFLYDRTFIAGSFAESWRRRKAVLLGLAAGWILLGWLVLSAGNRGGSVGFGQVAWGAYALTQAGALVTYLRLAVWPHPLIFDYGAEWVKSPASVLPEAGAVAALAAATAWGFFRRPALGFLGLWFFAILAPTSLMPGNRQTLAEHRMYLALVPIVALAVWSCRRWIRGAAGLAAVLALGGMLAAATARRNADYASDLALWGDTAAKRPDNPFAHNNVGVALFQRGDNAGAMAHFERALSLRPEYPEAHLNRGNSLFVEGRSDEAIREFVRALTLKPAYPEAYNDLGMALRSVGRREEARAAFEQALHLRPGYVEAHVNLGSIFGEDGRLDEAIRQFEQALAIDPGSAEAHANLATALLSSGNAARAAGEYERALRLKPDYADARRGLEAARAAAGGPAR